MKPFESNSSDSPAKAPVLGFGIDTVRLRGRATDRLLAQLPEKRFVQMCDDRTGVLSDVQSSGYTAVAAVNTFARVRADMRRGFPEVAVEFSAPSVLEGHNRNPLPVRRLVEVARQVYAGVESELTGLPDFEDLRLIRLDVDRDFVNVRSISSMLEAIAKRPASRVRRDDLRRGADGGWQSLTRGNSGSWLAVGYGKRQQLTEAAARSNDLGRRRLLQAAADTSHDTFRWELQLRRESLRKNNLNTLDEITEETIYDMSKKYFDRARFGDSIAGNSTRLKEALTDLSPAEVRGLLALLAADLHGIPAPMGHGLEDQSRATARRLGLAPHDLDLEGGVRRRLDFDAGTESCDIPDEGGTHEAGDSRAA